MRQDSTELSRHATIFFPTEAETVRQFIKGLNYGIRISMARGSEIATTFHQGVEIAWKISVFVASDKRL